MSALVTNYRYHRLRRRWKQRSQSLKDIDIACSESTGQRDSALIPARQIRGMTASAQTKDLIEEQYRERGIDISSTQRKKQLSKKDKDHYIVKMMGWDDMNRKRFNAISPAPTSSEAGPAAVHSPAPLEHPDTDAKDGANADADLSIENAAHALFVPQGSGNVNEKRKLSDTSVLPTSTSQKGSASKLARCTCDLGVSENLKEVMEREVALSSSSGQPLLARIFGSVDKGLKVCWAHLQKVASRLEVRNHRGGQEQPVDTLRRLHEDGIWEVRRHPDSITIFTTQGRPEFPSDKLGSYRFQHDPTDKFDFDANAILDEIDPAIRPAWERDGTVMINAFEWWWEKPADPTKLSIAEIVFSEFGCMEHHTRLISDTPNLGWQRNMFYSIGQQIMRQDPLYYLLYACLRTDKQWRLISYP